MRCVAQPGVGKNLQLLILSCQINLTCLQNSLWLDDLESYQRLNKILKLLYLRTYICIGNFSTFPYTIVNIVFNEGLDNANKIMNGGKIFLIS